jgi:hypothetical protein
MSVIRYLLALPAALGGFLLGRVLAVVLASVLLGVVSGLTGPEPMDPLGPEALRIVSGLGGLATAYYVGTRTAGVRP